MRHISVTTFIHILFLVAFSILVATFMLFKSWDSDREKIDEYKRYQLISISFLSKLSTEPTEDELQKLYSAFHLKVIPDNQLKGVIKKIESSAETIYNGGANIGRMRVFKLPNDKKYIYIERAPYSLMLTSDMAPNYYREIAISLALFLIVILLFIYWAILKKLSPLKQLDRQIQRFAKGDMDIQITYKYNDEIGKIAQSFDDAIKHINQLAKSKHLFMRNIMHELKTPITKGRIAVEMIDDEFTKDILIRAFERMNELISELAEIERVTSRSFEPNFEYLMLDEVIEEATKLLMSNQKLKLDIKPYPMTTDKKLMALVIKNLVDNGFKYGKGEVLIRVNGEIIEIVSQGDKLRHPLSYYTEPFSQEEKRSEGFGLGLYIVDNILQNLGYRLGYRYDKGSNIFMILPSQINTISC